jgi:hypothetical protein
MALPPGYTSSNSPFFTLARNAATSARCRSGLISLRDGLLGNARRTQAALAPALTTFTMQINSSYARTYKFCRSLLQARVHAAPWGAGLFSLLRRDYRDGDGSTAITRGGQRGLALAGAGREMAAAASGNGRWRQIPPPGLDLLPADRHAQALRRCPIGPRRPALHHRHRATAGFCRTRRRAAARAARTRRHPAAAAGPARTAAARALRAVRGRRSSPNGPRCSSSPDISPRGDRSGAGNTQPVGDQRR